MGNLFYNPLTFQQEYPASKARLLESSEVKRLIGFTPKNKVNFNNKI